MLFDSPTLLTAAPFVALVAVGLAWWARHARVTRAGRWSGELAATARRAGRFTPAVLGLIVFLAGLALAGPRWGRRVVTAEARGLDLVIAVDISRSMLAEDVAPSRLQRAQREASRLVHDLAGDRIGLIAFAGQSFILSPLTIDGAALQLLIDALHPDIASVGGTELAPALRQGHDLLLGGSEVADRVLVLVTDGEAHDSLGAIVGAAERLRRSGIRVIVVAEGEPAPAHIPIRDADGRLVEFQGHPDGGLVETWRRDNILRALADAAHAPVVAAALPDQAGAVRELVAGYKRSPEATTTTADRPPRGWIPVLGAVAMLLAHTLTRRTAALVGLGLVLVSARVATAQIPAGGSGGAGGAGNAADSAWARGELRLAAQRYLAQVRAGEGGDTSWYNAGTAALAIGDTALARRALGRAAGSLDPDLRFRALYNLGLLALRLAADSTARDRHLETARERYREALLIRPDDGAAKWNLELAVRQRPPADRAGAPPPAGGGGAEEQPPPQEQRGGLTLAQARQILNSIAEEERETRRSLGRLQPGREPRGRRNW